MSYASDSRGRDTITDTTPNRSSIGQQALRRKVNRRVQRASGDATCRDLLRVRPRLCADHLKIDLDLYEAVHNTPGRYAVTTHHDNDRTQRHISRHHGFLVIERT